MSRTAGPILIPRAPCIWEPTVTSSARDRLVKALREYLAELGVDVGSPGMRDTPERWVSALEEYTEGLRVGFEEWKVFDSEESSINTDGELVIVRDIPFSSICEHHLLPFFGKVHIAYVPGREIVGLSKFARLVSWLAARPQVQERLTGQIADHVMNMSDAKGVLVIIEAVHTCMVTRGARSYGSRMVTLSARGVLKAAGLEEAALQLLGIR